MTAPALPPVLIRGEEHVDRGYCYSVADGMDGYCVHTASCRYAGDTAFGPGSTCVRPGEDGAVLKAQREAEADRLRFTPPEYRPFPRTSGPVIEIVDPRAQVTDVVALRGRPRISHDTDDTNRAGEWTTWETFRCVDPAYTGPRLFAHMHEVPVEFTPEEAAALVAEFTARVPHYEFALVRARLVIEEQRLA